MLLYTFCISSLSTFLFAEDVSSFTALLLAASRSLFFAPQMADVGPVCRVLFSTIIAFTNTYQKEDMEQFADELNKSKRFAENLEPIINMMMHNNIMNHTPDGEPILTSASTDTQVPVRIGELIDYMEQDKEMLGELMFRWLPIVDMDVKNNPITVLYKP